MKNIVSIGFTPLIPYNFGGAVRIMNLNIPLANKYKVESYCITYRNPFQKTFKTGNLMVKFIFKPLLTAVTLPFWLLKVPYGFICTYKWLFGKLPVELYNSLNSSDLIILEAPHMFKWVYEAFPKKKYVLAQQNVELDLEMKNFSKNNKILRNIVTNRIKKTEQFALEKATLITAVSQADRMRLSELYGINPIKIECVPNGYDKSFLNAELNEAPNNTLFAKELKDKFIVLFVGSEHKPNYEALSLIENVIAPKFTNIPEIIFLIVGGVGKAKARKIVSNIAYTGVVKDVQSYSRAATIALNPISSGSGTNIKLLEYLAQGIPTISTEFGIRGINLSDKEVRLSTISDFYINIRDLFSNKEKRLSLGKAGHLFVRDYFTWENISKKYIEAIERCL